MQIQPDVTALIGNTRLLKIPSLSRLTGCEILIKCEFDNPGGSIKDRAALQMIRDAMQRGELKPGMTVVEGTAGNTGIGLALVARALGLNMLCVMPRGQAAEKQRMVELFGAQLHLVDPCPFSDENHFYHTARRLSEDRPGRWWANQFDNISNYQAHLSGTGPEIWAQTDGRLDALVSVSGTGGTIAGGSNFLKSQDENIQVWLIDPDGSGLHNHLAHGEFSATGSSITEGIGIMRVVENFRRARIDRSVNLPDADLITVAHALRANDGILVGSSSALNVAGALLVAAQGGAGRRIVTFACDDGQRSASKLYNPEFLAAQGLDTIQGIDALWAQYRRFDPARIVQVETLRAGA